MLSFGVFRFVDKRKKEMFALVFLKDLKYLNCRPMRKVGLLPSLRYAHAQYVYVCASEVGLLKPYNIYEHSFNLFHRQLIYV